MANLSDAPQWMGFINGSAPAEKMCWICMKSGAAVTPCPGCPFRVHQRCYDDWKCSSACGTCPGCSTPLITDPDSQVTFRLGTRVILGGGPEAPLVTVVGMRRSGPGRREYVVATSSGDTSYARPPDLKHLPICRVCKKHSGCMEFNQCNCRGSLLQFCHRGCTPVEAHCPVCEVRLRYGVTDGSSKRDPDTSTWSRIRAVFS